MIGSTIGRYKIVERLGSGGMGEVFKAEDTTLGRPVALKFLAAHLLHDDEAKARFFREAKAAAAVSHPNICHVYEIAEESGKTFLAMDYLEGESLEERIEKGPLPIKDALDIGRQVAEGLEAAHEKGIVHRDIKPANIMVDAKGRGTILDFGLARLTEASKLTRADQTVGTAAYMSPEQVQGGDVDHRTDVWALGCVLYEMVAGLRPFKGQYDQALAYEIVQEAPEPLTGVRAGVPLELEFLVGKCLAKEAAQRYQHADELAVDLRTQRERLKSGRSTVMSSVVGAAGPSVSAGAAQSSEEITVLQRKLRAFKVALAALVVVAIAICYYAMIGGSGKDGSPSLRKFSLSASNPDANINRAIGSPDGRYIAYLAGSPNDGVMLIHDFEQDESRTIDGLGGVQPAGWTPDSKWIAGYTNGSRLVKIPIGPGPPVDLGATEQAAPQGRIAWTPAGSDLVISGGIHGLTTIHEANGSSEPWLEGDRSERPVFYEATEFLPSPDDDPVLLVTARDGLRREVMIHRRGQAPTALGIEGNDPVYSPSGHILFVADRTLWAAPFSARTVSVTGDPFVVRSNALSPSVSKAGTLFYVQLGTRGFDKLVQVDRKGSWVRDLGQPQQEIRTPSVSPDGASVAAAGGEDRSIWLHEVSRNLTTKLTSAQAGSDGQLIWPRSGNTVAFSRLGSVDGWDIFSKRLESDEAAVPLVEGPLTDIASDWAPDGGSLLYFSSASNTNLDIWYLERQTDGRFRQVPFLQTEANERIGKFSPDGKWVAYCSDESGAIEIYMRRFPDASGKRRVSTNGGTQPRWNPHGGELFYVENDTLMSVSIETGDALKIGRPQRLFRRPNLISPFPTPNYDVMPDGESFVLVEPVEGGEPSKIVVVQNWFEEFRY